MTEPLYDKINELLKTIRNSQRNIALVCFVALASIWSFDGNDLEAVNDELRQIRSLASTWDNNAVWLANWARRNSSAGTSEVALKKPLVFIPQDHGVDHQDSYKNPGLIAKKVEAWSVLPLPAALTDLREKARRKTPNAGADDLMLAMPNNMVEFKEFWDELGRVVLKSRVFDSSSLQRKLRYRRLYFAEDIDEASDVWFDEILNSRKLINADKDFTEVVLKLRGMDTGGGSFTDRRCNGESWWCRPNNHLKYNAVLYSGIVVSKGSGRGDRYTIAIPVNAEEVVSSARTAFRSFYADKTSDVTNWSDTDFEFAFPALHRYAKNGRETLRLSDLNIVVQSDLARSPDRISVFGATIPVGDIGVWVIAAVLALQLLFMAQLLELHRLLKTETTDEILIIEPWAGMFRGVFGRIAAIAACVVLPVGLSVFINVQFFGTFVSTPMVVLGMISTFVGSYIGFLIWNSNRHAHNE